MDSQEIDRVLTRFGFDKADAPDAPSVREWLEGFDGMAQEAELAVRSLEELGGIRLVLSRLGAEESILYREAVQSALARMRRVLASLWYLDKSVFRPELGMELLDDVRCAPPRPAMPVYPSAQPPASTGTGDISPNPYKGVFAF